MKRSNLSAAVIALSACAEATESPTAGHLNPGPALSVFVTATEAILPSGYAGLMGETNNSFPHTVRNLRYQQVFLGSELSDPKLVGVCLRRDEAFGGPSSTQTLTIRLGPTSLDHNSLGTGFDANYSAPPTEVFSGVVTVPASSALGTPADFDFCIPFTQSYSHAAGSNMIIEVLNTSAVAATGQPRDACSSTAACTTTRAFAFSATAANAALVARGGLVMKFVSPEPPPPVDPVNAEECKLGAWADFGFRNQGQCIRFVETGYDSRQS